jgi:S1-C subfamily serine protease
MTVMRLVVVAVTIGIVGLGVVGAAADDLQPVRADLERALPQETLQRFFESHPLVFRGAPPRGSTIYRERVNGVVLIASTKALGTGVLVSDDGDIVTNEHVVQAAYRAQGHEWVAVWFKPPPGTRPVRHNFLLGKVLQRNAQHDLARIRVVDGLPPTARVVPMAAVTPAVGQDVFTIGHPRTDLWSFGEGKVAQIRTNYRWQYADGIARSATAIQTRAPVDPGSSGGPLLDGAGAIVGIVVGSASPAPGVYFAVSVEHVHELLPR